MKYIDADLLRKEIEKRKQIHFNDYFVKKSGNPADYGASNALAQVLPLIDSLQQEQQEEPDKSLEEAAEEYLQKVKAGFLRTLDHPTAKDCFIHGADWQKQQMLKDAVEGEAEELYNDGESQCTVGVGTYFKPGERVYVLKAMEDEE